MTNARRLLAGAAVIAAASACEWVAGIRDRDFTVAEASPVDASAPPPDAIATADAQETCVPAAPPARPHVDDPAGSVELVVALRQVGFGLEPGAVVGFDLDGRCSCDPRTHDAAATCVPPTNASVQSDCDAVGGVDNALGNLFRELPASVLIDAAVRHQLDCGRQSILMTVTNWNGQADDPDVLVTFTPSYGIRTPHPDGEVVRDGCGSGEEGYFPPKWNRTDVWTRYREGDLFAGWVAGGRLVIDARSLLIAVRFPLGQQPLSIRSLVFSARIVGEKGQYALTEGVIAGSVRADEILVAAGAMGRESAPFCAAGAPYSEFKRDICASLDSSSVPRQNANGLACDALSMAITFEAAPATVGGERPPDETAHPCGAGWRDSCPTGTP